MENVKPNLLLNYNRKNGKPWDNLIFPTLTGKILYTSSVRRLEELLIPGAGKDPNNTLTAISNAIYIEARRYNMSLSNFGHLDPIKFCLAAGYLLMMMAEVRRNMGIALKYEFDSVYYGKTLAQAAGFDLNSAITDYTTNVVKYNLLATRINNLMIPELKLFYKWLAHRCNVYKDDEGDRFSIYLYHMYNYYQLDVDPNSSTVGQLLFKRWEYDVNSGVSLPTISGQLALIENVLKSYEGDDDMVHFATEAIKAGMGHFTIEQIPSDKDAFAKVALNLIYDLDDIFSQENARFIKPIIGSSTLTLVGGSTIDLVCSWDITETNDTFSVGGYAETISGTTTVHKDILPFAIPNNMGAGSAVDIGNNLGVERYPLVTHSKIESVDGLDYLTRYVVAGSRLKSGLNISSLGSGTLAVYDVEVKTFTISGIAATTATAGNVIYGADVHGTEMLLGEMVFIEPVDNNGSTYDDYINPNIWFNYLCALPSRWMAYDIYQAIAAFNRANLGFKAGRIAYFWSSYRTGNMPTCLGHDFDYITGTSSDALANFFETLAWNYSQLGRESAIKYNDNKVSNKHNKHRTKKPSQKEEDKPKE